MWRKGKIEVENRTIQYWIKSFDLGSPYGIDEGRISKLMLKRDGQIIANFDRGWDIEPIDANAQAALEIFTKKYN
ncbi:DUF7678 domain-containing protein [Proteiniclasticum ruminis]|uniref:DUF7678 domain-containing protein n=1 Tax=Proteiniclasticum ruminis TaxID=398199 RepID=UPI0028A69A15|nr:hypothetical protein [Proteiniclasticum ruminis]